MGRLFFFFSCYSAILVVMVEDLLSRARTHMPSSSSRTLICMGLEKTLHPYPVTRQKLPNGHLNHQRRARRHRKSWSFCSLRSEGRKGGSPSSYENEARRRHKVRINSKLLTNIPYSAHLEQKLHQLSICILQHVVVGR